MRNLLKRFSIFATVATMFTFLVSAGAVNYVNLRVNDEVIGGGVTPFEDNGVTMVPIRVISEKLNAKVQWIGEKQQVIISKDALKIVLTIGSTTAVRNGQEITLAAAPTVVNDITYVPIRFVAENLSCTVLWDGGISTALVISSTQDISFDNYPSILSIKSIYPNIEDPNEYATEFKESAEGFDSYSYHYLYKTNTLERAETCARIYVDYLKANGYRVIKEEDDPIVAQSIGKDILYTIIPPDDRFYMTVKGEGNWAKDDFSYNISITIVHNNGQLNPDVGGGTFYESYYGVPDFGKKFYIKPSYQSKDMMVYDVQTQRASDMIDTYVGTLENNGFVFIGSFNDEDGDPVVVYEKKSVKKSVSIGTMFTNGQAHILVMVSNSQQ